MKEVLGRRFGRLVVLEGAGRNKRGKLLWRCRCDCSEECIVIGSFLRNGHTKSCGCARREKAAVLNVSHGLSRSPEYIIWRGMILRCENESQDSFARYGGRGIKVCQRWRDSLEAFYADMGPRPSEDHSIDRIDNDGNYEPGNCRWATAYEQGANRHDNHEVTIFGKTRRLIEVCRETGINSSTAIRRLERGWSPEEALGFVTRATISGNGAKTHCRHGHPFSGDNLYLRPDGGRDCRACAAARKAKIRRGA